MAIIIENNQIAQDIFILEAVPDQGMPMPRPGQFYMVRTWERFPLLSRPISVFDFDINDSRIKFLYQVVGRGTDMLSQIAVSSNILLDGPYGVGFPEVDSDIVLIGGGIGIAPLYYTAKIQKQLFPHRNVRTYLGYSQLPFAMNYFQGISDHLVYDVGNMITDSVIVRPGETVFCCGPEAMMEAVARQVPAENDLYLSFESHMACGLGACLGCTRSVPISYQRRPNSKRLEPIDLKGKPVRICTDGPVFRRQVYR